MKVHGCERQSKYKEMILNKKKRNDTKSFRREQIHCPNNKQVSKLQKYMPEIRSTNKRTTFTC